MSNIIQFPGMPNRATRKALMDEAVREAELGFTDEELADLREALRDTKREEMIARVRKQCIAVNTFLHELLESYKNT